MPNRLPCRIAAGAALLLFATLISFPAGAQAPAETAADRLQSLKSLQRDLIMREGRERIEKALHNQAAARLGGARPEGARRVGERSFPSGDQERVLLPVPETGETQTGLPRPARAENFVGSGIAPNVRVNDTAGDEAFASQNEPSIAAWGNYVLSAYNDLPSLTFTGSVQGFAYSIDGGATFVDGGEIPVPADSFFWSSDPVVTVNEKTGEFYYCGLLQTFENPETFEFQNGVGMGRGTFSGSSFTWSPARVVRLEPANTHFIDKPWIVADSLSGNLYVSYTDFTLTGNSIAFQRSPNKGVSWFLPLTLSSAAASGAVQGSRPALGPNGEVYVTWKELGPADPGFDFMRIRTSTDHGASFGGEHTAATFFDDYGTGAPGFNRERSIALPSIAVDRTTGPHRGRLYVSWNESLNWYDDAPPLGIVMTETENNDFFAAANAMIPGQTISGAFDTSDDIDFYSFSATQGTSYLFWARDVPQSLYSMRVFCSDTLTRIAFTGKIKTPLDDSGNQSILVWTAPATGTYYLRMFYVDDGGDPGPYQVRSAIALPGPGDRGRDQRDAFVAWSDDATVWSVPVRINQDPPYYDNWLPEVTVSGFGTVYATWYDWRDSPAGKCGAVSNTYVARSEDSGPTWVTLGSLTDASSEWTPENSNLIPNQGDYLGLFANDAGVYATWTDRRGGDPDIYSVVLPAAPETLQVSASAEALSSRITVTWRFRVPRIVSATLYRQQGEDAPVAIGPVFTDAGGNLIYDDTAVTRGVRYSYMLGIATGAGEAIVGRVSATVPTGRLVIRPNPLRRSTTIEFDVPPPGGNVSLVIYDLQGRAVRKLVNGYQLSGPGQAVWDAKDDGGRAVRPGLYLIRLVQPGKKVTQRLSVIP